MDGWPVRSTYLRRIAAIVAGCALAYGGARAELLSSYFPAGVPGYGTSPGVTVASRERPDFDPLGTRIGDFTIRPQIEEGLGYDDNVFGSDGNRLGSWILGTHPSLLVNSDWSRDSIGGYIGADDLRYLDQPQQSRTDWTASVGGTLAVGRDELTVAVAHLGLHQDRTELDALPTDEPVAYQVDDVRAGYTFALNRISITPGIEFSTFRYDSTTILGVPTPQAYRDRNVLQGMVTTRYELTPQRNLLVVIRALGSDYVAPQPGQPTRNSTGYQALFGFGDDSDAVWRYRVLVGWELRDFAASQFGSHQAPIAEGELIWSPSGLTTVAATLTRSIEDAAQEDVAGYTYTSARLTLDHEYRRDVLLRLSAGVQRADFLQGGGQADGFTVDAGVTWLLNRHMRLSADYGFTDQRSTSNPTLPTAGSYTRSIGLLTLRFAL
jgi:hypothetical protein